MFETLFFVLTAGSNINLVKEAMVPVGECVVCGQANVKLPFVTPEDHPFFGDGGRHCQECEDWLQGKPHRKERAALVHMMIGPMGCC